MIKPITLIYNNLNNFGKFLKGGFISLKKFILILIFSFVFFSTTSSFADVVQLENGTKEFPVNVIIKDQVSGIKNLKILINGQVIANIDYTGEFPKTQITNEPLKIPDSIKENVEVDVVFVATDRLDNKVSKTLYTFKIKPLPETSEGDITKIKNDLEEVLSDPGNLDLNKVEQVVEDILESMLPNPEKKEALETVVDTLISVDTNKDYTEDNRVRLMSAANIQEKVIALDVTDPKAYLKMIEIRRRLELSNYLDYVKIKTAKGEITIMEVDNKTYIPIEQATELLGIDTNIESVNVRTMDSSFGFKTDTGYLFVYPDGKVIGHPTMIKADVKMYYGKMYIYKPDLEDLLDSNIYLYDIPEDLRVTYSDHWAYPYAKKVIEVYSVQVDTEHLDDPAPVELQERLFALANLDIPTEENMARFWPFYYMVQALDVELDKNTNTYEILKDYDDACETCIKANDTLAKAEKIGLLSGRSYPDGTVKLDIKEPITNGELCALILRYMKIFKNSIY